MGDCLKPVCCTKNARAKAAGFRWPIAGATTTRTQMQCPVAKQTPVVLRTTCLHKKTAPGALNEKNHRLVWSQPCSWLKARADPSPPWCEVVDWNHRR